MLATTFSAALVGLEAYPIRVEVEASRGVPSFELVGLAEAAVRESRVRVKSALAQIGIDICDCRIVVNLGPADVKKGGSGFDLAIAMATLAALRVTPAASLEGAIFLGELSLTGSIHAVRGILPHILGARSRGVRCAIVPVENEAEAALVEGFDVRVVATLHELVKSAQGEGELRRAASGSLRISPRSEDDFSEIRGQGAARRALEIAAAGGHNVLMIGPPGSGKTMLARRMPGILPALTVEEALEVTALHSISGSPSPAGGLSRERPFRSPHHTVSEAALVGGGDWPRPGEVSLAHHGILFLDELPEFRRPALEALRQPLEEGMVTICRAQAQATFPARPILVCAMNPCPCGYQGDGSSRCSCVAARVRAYRARLSGPLLDRIDVHVVLPPVTIAALQEAPSGDSSAAIRQRVEGARATQHDRLRAGLASAVTNAAIPPRDLQRVARLCDASQRMLSAAGNRLALSARAYGKLLRVARTIADLEQVDDIEPAHVAEAIGLRVLDRGAGRSSPASAA